MDPAAGVTTKEKPSRVINDAMQNLDNLDISAPIL
jgi:hypothetical protein